MLIRRLLDMRILPRIVLAVLGATLIVFLIGLFTAKTPVKSRTMDGKDSSDGLLEKTMAYFNVSASDSIFNNFLSNDDDDDDYDDEVEEFEELRTTEKPHTGPRRLYVVRHGERVDFAVGKTGREWLGKAFNEDGDYIRFDLNLPKWLPPRSKGPIDYKKDPPLSAQGQNQARILGEALKDLNVTFSVLYASPSFRCVETAKELLKGMGLNMTIYIEPGLVEWFGWFHRGFPSYISNDEYLAMGYNVGAWEPIIWPFSIFTDNESPEQHYARCHNVVKHLLERHKNDGNVMVVAHATSPEVCTRILVGLEPRSSFVPLLGKHPYCSMYVAEEDEEEEGKWHLIPPLANTSGFGVRRVARDPDL